MRLQFKRTSTVGERMISFIIDHFILTFLLMTVVFSSLFSYLEGSNMIFSVILIFISPFVYILKDVFNGRSIGKRVFNIGVRCVENPNELPSTWRLLLRNITIIIWPIEFFVMIFNVNGIRLGDMLAKTIVVKLERREDNFQETINDYSVSYNKSKPVSKKKVVKVIILAFLILSTAIFGLIGGISSIMKNSGAYKTTVSQIESDERIISEIGEIKGYGFMPTGSISINNGYGEAELLISIKGEVKDIRVFSKLHKEPSSEWRIDVLEVIN